MDGQVLTESQELLEVSTPHCRTTQRLAVPAWKSGLVLILHLRERVVIILRTGLTDTNSVL